MDPDLASLVADVSPWITAAVGADGQAVLTAPATDEAVGVPVRLGRQILQRIFRTRGQAPPPQAVADLAAEPHDPDLQAALRVEIRRALTQDPQLAQDIRQMLAESPAVSPAASIFLSHAHEDNDVAHQLTVALAREGVAPWLDAQELYAGEELLANIAQALAEVDYFALLLTRAALTKRWVLAETRMALTREIEVGRPKVLVLLLEDCEIPVELRHKLFLDFRGRFNSAVAELAAQVRGADLSIPMPKQAVLAEMIANADAELWARLQAGLGSEEKWEQDEAANVDRFVTWVEIIPENPFAASGETEHVGFGLPVFDDLGLLRD
jgi:hypothetical protein